MKKSLSSLLDKLTQQSNESTDALNKQENRMGVITSEEAVTVRGGDKEYIPIYDDPQEHTWEKPSTLFDFK